MTINRLFTWSAENSNAVGATVFDVFAIATSFVHTGSKSYQIYGISDGIRGVTSTSQIRGHYFVAGTVSRYISSYRPTFVGLHAVNVTDPPTHYVMWNLSNDTLEMYVNGTLVAQTNAVALGLNSVYRWRSVGFTAKAHATSGFFSFYLDGEKVLTFTGNVPSWTGVGVGGRPNSFASNWTYAYLDDIYIDSTVGELDAPPPQKRFLSALPNAAGADAAWTPSTGSNYQNVDDTPHDSDTTYNYAESVSLKDTFNFSNISEISGGNVLESVRVTAYAKKSEGSSAQIKIHAFDGSTYQSSIDLGLTTSYSAYVSEFSVQNDTTDWNVTDFNAYQFGYESSGSF